MPALLALTSVDVHEIVDRAATVMQADWAAAPDFAFVQRDPKE